MKDSRGDTFQPGAKFDSAGDRIMGRRDSRGDRLYQSRAKRRHKRRGRRHSAAHPGFKGVAGQIAARQGVSGAAAQRILGAATNRNPILRARAARNRG